MPDTQLFFDAIRKGDAAAVRAMLAADARLAGARDDKGLSAVLNATYYRQPQIVAELIAAGAPLDLWEAAVAGRLERLRELLDRDPAQANSYSADGFAPLHASYFAPPEAIELLLARGADPNALSRNPMALRPLHSAASAGNARVVELLLRAGADPNARQHGGWTPIHAAAQSGNVAVIKLLLQHGADARLANDTGATAMSLAQEKGQVAVIELLESGTGQTARA